MPRHRIPLTRAQRGVWAAQRLFPTATAYRVGQLVWLDGAVDSGAFADAVADTFAEAEALHARCADDEGSPFQWIDDTLALSTQVVDEPTADDEIRRIARASYVQAVDPAAPLTSSTLRRRTDGTWAWDLSTHHLLIDAYGLSLFTRRVAERYSAALSDEAAPARWFGSWQQVATAEHDAAADAPVGAGTEGAAPAWAEALGDAETRGHAADVDPEQLFALSNQRALVPLTASAGQRLHDAARDAKVSWAAYVTALWGVYDALADGRQQVLLRVPFMMRHEPAALRTPGMLVTTLPVAVSLTGVSTFGDAAREVAAQLRVAGREQRWTEERVARSWPGGELDYRTLPLINIKALDYQARFGRLLGRQETVNAGPVGRLDLTVYADAVHGFRLEIAGHEAFGDVAALTVHAERFARFVEAVVGGDEGQRLSELPTVVGDADLARVETWSRVETSSTEPGHTGEQADLDTLLRAQARRTPDAVAIEDDGDGEKLTFARFDARVQALATLLVGRGVAVGDRVGVLLPRSADLVVTLAAIIRAGAAWVPVDTSYPAERVEYVFADAAVSAIVTDEATAVEHRAGLAGLAAHRVLLDAPDVAAAMRRGSDRAPTLARTLTPADVAYVVYTSGTTGRPKGVQVSHGSIVHRLAWAVEVHGLAPQDRILQKTPATFDACMWEFFGALLVGGTVVVARDGGHKDPEYLADVIARRRVTVAHFVPSMLQAFLLSDPDPERLTSLRQVFVSGEAFPVAAAADARRVFGDARIDNVYGPTETTVDVTYLPLDVASLGDHLSVVPIGGPPPGVRALVLDGWLRPVGPGVVGELYIGGVQLADGYVGRFGLTAERFVADPFGGPGARLYRTGDLVRWDAEGHLEYLGRSDDQVKVRGFRIELEEIRAVLEQADEVTSAAVLALDHPAGGRFLAAYVTLEGDVVDADGIAERLRAFAASTLPDFMVPTTVTVVDAIPVTANGKLDRAALPTPVLGAGGGAAGRDPASATELALATVFRDVLAFDDHVRLSVDDDFFRLGGDSILSIQVVSRARRLGVSVTAAEVFTTRTIGALATLADRRVATSPAAAPAPVEVSSSRLWPIAAAAVDEPGFAAFAQSFVFTTPPGLDEHVLRRTCTRVVDHHAALRGRLRTDGDAVRFEVRDPGAVSVDGRLTLERLADPALAQTLPARIAEETAALAQALDPAAGELWRAAWFPGDDAEPGRLLWVIHHLVVDGVSWRILGDDLAQAWRIETGQTEEPLLPVGTGLPSWSEALHAAGETLQLAEQAGHWAETVSGVDPPLGSRALERERDTYATVRRIEVTVPTEVARAALTTVPHTLTAEVNDVLLGALTVAVGAWRSSRGDDHRRVLVGLEGHGREETLVPGADLSRTVGWFTTRYPLALDTDDIDPVRATTDPRAAADAILRVKERLRAVPARGIGYGVLHAAEPIPGNTPQIGFNYLGRFTADAGPWSTAPEQSGLRAHLPAELPLPALIDINAAAVGTGARVELVATFDIASAVDEHDVREIARLWVETLSTLQRGTEHGAVRRSPSDLTARDTVQADVDAWQAVHGELADVQPLTPLQRGIVVESLLAEADAVDLYVTQTILDTHGDIDPERLRAAFRRVLERYPNLRAAIGTTGAGEHVAIVPSVVPVPLAVVDAAGDTDPLATVARRADADRAAAFSLATAPLLRVSLVRTSQSQHTIVLTMHHVLADGWSTPRLVDALAAAYRTQADVEPHRAHRDFLTWLDERDEAASLAHWTLALQKVHEPTLIAPGAASGPAGFPDERRWTLDAERSAALRNAAQRADATLSTLMQAAWGVALNAVTGQDTVVFGSVVSGRHGDIDGIEDAVGLFINTVPTPVALGDNPTLSALVRRVQEHNTALLDHHHVPLTHVHLATGHHPLFDTLVVYENYPFDELDASDAAHDTFVVDGVEIRDSTHYPLALAVLPQGDRIGLRCTSRPDRLDAADVERLCALFERVLDAFAAAATLRIADLDLADAAPGDASALSALPATTVDALLLAQIEVAATDVALIDDEDGSTLTYAQFGARVDAFAHLLRERGIGVSARVAVAVTRSIALAVVVAGVLRVGAAYVPVDPAYPAERIALVVAQSHAELVVADASTAGHLDGVAVPTLLVDDSWPRRVAAEHEAPSDVPAPDSTASVIFTSGTTGIPKGVVLSHRALANRLTWGNEELGYGRGAVAIAKSGIGFVDATTELLGPLTAGAAVVMVSDRVARDPAALRDVIRRRAVTHLLTVPSLSDAFASARVAEHDTDALTSLRSWASSGEVLTPASAERMRRVAPNAVIRNLYGSTEVTGDATSSAVSAADGTVESVTLGEPVAGAKAVVLDAWLRPVGPGIAGELYVGGVQLADGYTGRHARTAERFVADPAGSGSRLYRTGDIVRWTPAGELEHLGRADDQVKIRGMRVEPDEARVAIERHRGVSGAVVVALDHPTGGTFLAAYITSDPAGPAPAAADIRAFARSVLPEHLVPATVTLLQAFPVTPNGKLDRDALPTPSFGAADAVAVRAPETETEVALSRVFREVLALDAQTELSVDADFFDLGGHSLLATRVVARANTALASSLTLRDVFDEPTIERLAHVVDRAGRAADAIVPVGAFERPAQLPASFGQQSLWLLDRLGGADASYIVPVAMQLTGVLDEAALHGALLDVIARHEALRTLLVDDDGRPFQSIVSIERLPELLSWTAEDVADADALDGRVARLVQTRFDLATELPIRAGLLRRSVEDHVLVLAVHHHAVDEWSLRSLLGDLSVAYRARLGRRAPSWVPLSVQYADYALWQRRTLGAATKPGSTLATHLDHWREQLADAPAESTIATDRPRPVDPTHSGADVSFTLAAATVDGLRRRGAEVGATTFMLAHAAAAVAVSILGGADDIVIGSPVGGRTADGLEHLVGYFVNTLPIRHRLGAADTLADVVAATRHAVLDAFAHQDAPFEHIVAATGIERSAERNPLFQVLLTCHVGAQAQGLDLAGVEVGQYPVTLGAAKMDLDLALHETPAGIDGLLTYATELFDPSSAERFVAVFEAVLQAIAATPEMPIAELEPEAIEAPRSAVGTEPFTEPGPPDATLDALLRAQALAMPDAVAVADDDDVRLTYRELDERVDAFAHVLIDRGVRVGDRVAVLLPRSVRLVETLAAVLRAGAAYVPVDPAYPSERVAAILDDAGVGLAVVDDSTAAAHAAALKGVGSVDASETPSHPRSGVRLARPVDPADTAYVIFTSGTTGRPKGVAVTHRSIVHLIRWRQRTFPLAPGDRVLQRSSVGFDVSVPEFFWPLAVGAAVRMIRPGGERDAAYLAALLRGEEIAYADFVPTMVRALVDEGEDLSSFRVRHLTVGSERVPVSVARALRAPGRTVWNLYGPTEATVEAVGLSLSELAEDASATPIGHPLGATTAHVLDAWLRPVAPGVTGELYLGGPQVAEGYVGRHALTAERFVADPTGAGARVYRTGDLVRWNPGGHLEYLGRSDDQVKVRGFRIELDEVRTALERHPAVSSAVVIVRERTAGGGVLAAYVTAAEASGLEAQLQTFVGSLLPEYMVPTTVTRLDAFPVTANGKLDVAALPVPSIESGLGVHGGRAPESDTELALAAAFREVLGFATDAALSADDDFFRLGGDSILAIQAVSRARRRGVTISAAEVFGARTVAALAALADRRAGVEAAAGRSPIAGEASASRLWPIAAQAVTEPGFDAFAQSFAFVTPAGLDESTLHRVLGRVIGHHAALRGRLVRADGAVRFEIQEADATAVSERLTLEHVTSAWTAQEWLARVDAVTAALSESLDLEAGLLWRAAWFPAADGAEGRLVVVIHHLVVDGVSWRVLGDDLQQAWELETAHSGELLAVGTGLPTWAEMIAARAADDDLAAQRDHWSRVVADVDPPLGSRPLDAARDTAATVELLRVSVPGDVTRAVIADVPHALNAEVNDVLLSALAVAVGVWRSRRGLDHRRVRVGLEGHGREETFVPGADLSRTVGWFTTWYPVALDTDDIDPDLALTDASAAADAVLRVKEHLRAVPDRGIGYGILRTHGAPLPDALPPEIGFNYLGQFAGADETTAWSAAPELPGLRAHVPRVQPATAALDITVAVTADARGAQELAGAFAYATGVLGEAEVRELADLWAQALQTLAHGAGQRIRRSPSDVTATGVSQADLDAWEHRYGELVDVQPLTPLQQGIAFESTVGGTDGVDAYTTQTVLHLDGELDVARLQRALDAVLAQHPQLSAAITTTQAGEQVAVIPAVVDATLAVVDAAGADDPEAVRAQTVEAAGAASFDLAEAPLLRTTIVTTAPREHAVVLTMHHVLADGWSMPRIVHALLAAYDEPGTGTDAAYPAFLRWLGDRDHLGAQEVWAQVLAAVDEPTLLAPHSAALSELPSEITFATDDATTAGLVALARRADATLSTVVQTAWGVFLAAVTGQETVVFGSTVSGRPAEIDGIEDAIGLFINTIPIPVTADGADDLTALVARVQAQHTRVFDHHHEPLSALQRLAGHNPLFDTLVVYENYPLDEDDRGEAYRGVRLREVEGRDATHYPLALAVVPRGGELAFHLTYRADLLPARTAERYGAVFRAVLSAMAETPTRRIAELRTLVGDDAGDVEAWAKGPRTTAQPTTLDALLRAQATRTPDATAVLDDTGAAYGYAQLDVRVNALAHVLIDRGVAVGDRVGVLLPRGLGFVVAVAAVVRAGAAYVPIDPDYPAERIAVILEDAAPSVVVADDPADLASYVSSDAIVALCDPTVADALSHGRADAPTLLRPLVPQDTAYVIFTSGTTGRPKGVAVSHGAVANLIAWRQDTMPLAVGDRVLQKSSPGFDVSVPELFWPLAVGAVVRLIRAGGERDIDGLARLLRTERFGYTAFLPSVVRALTADGHDLSEFRVAHVAVGSESVPVAVARALAAPGRGVWNMYGPTEAAVEIAAYDVADLATDATSTPIGRPLPNTTFRVLDAWLREVPVGTPGELYLGGAQLAEGYLGRPGLTAERFVADPFGGVGTRLYRTGDVVRWNDDGQLEHLGRVDDQVKVRGFRIELAEVGGALERHPAVTVATVLALDHPAGGKQLAAYVAAPTPHAQDLVAALRAHAASLLPEYMVPTWIVVLDALPTLTNGKLDRGALPAPDLDALVVGGRPAQSRSERVLAAVFRDVLRLPEHTELGADDDFFRLGGDSIMSIQAVSQARRAGVSVSAAEVFTIRTIGGLAAVADARVQVEVDGPQEVSDCALWPIAARHVGAAGFTSFTQSFVFATPPQLTDEVLERVLARVVDRHAALRGRLERVGETWRFRIEERTASHVRERLAPQRPWPGADVAETVRAAVGELSRTLDPERGLLWRAQWFPGVAHAPGRLLVVIHHLVVDGVSWRILGDDLKHAWELARGTTHEPLVPTGTGIAAWSEALASRATDADVVAQLDHWKEATADPGVHLGSRRLEATTDTYASAGAIPLHVSAEVTRSLLVELPRLLTAGVDAVLLGALTSAVGAWQASRGVDHRTLRLGLEGHGREESLVPGSDLTRTIGWFTSWYPVSVSTDDVDPEVAVADPRAGAEAVLRVKEHLARVPGKGLGFGLLRYLHPDTRDVLADGSIPDIGFNYLGRFAAAAERELPWDNAAEVAGIDGYTSGDLVLPAPVDINVAATDSGDGPVLSGTLTFARGVLSETEAAELGAHWTRALATLHEYARTARVVRRSPSDLTADGVTPGDLAAWEERYGALNDVHPLTPLQEGLAFQSGLSAQSGLSPQSEDVDVYVVQSVFRLHGPVDAAVLERAFARVLERYPNLRAGIVPGEDGAYVAVIPEHAAVPFVVIDGVAADDLERRAHAVAAHDRARPFDLAAPPLVRATLVSGRGDEHCLVLTMHHVLIDGWSTPLLITALFEAYAEPDRRREPDGVYTTFLTWLGGRDRARSQAAWAKALEPVTAATLVAGPQLVGPADATLAAVDGAVSAEALGELTELPGVTVNTAVQTAWGVALSDLLGDETVVFGAIVSGRPADVDGIEDAVGLFINTIATPVTVRADLGFDELIGVQQGRSNEVLDHHHVPLSTLHRIARRTPLFDSLVVYESYPVDEDEMARVERATGFAVRDVVSSDATHYPVTLIVEPGATLRLRVAYMPALVSRETALRLLETTRFVLEHGARSPRLRVAQLRELVRVARTAAADDADAGQRYRVRIDAFRAQDAGLWRAAVVQASIALGASASLAVDESGRGWITAVAAHPGALDAVAALVPELVDGYRDGAVLEVVPDRPVERAAPPEDNSSPALLTDPFWEGWLDAFLDVAHVSLERRAASDGDVARLGVATSRAIVSTAMTPAEARASAAGAVLRALGDAFADGAVVEFEERVGLTTTRSLPVAVGADTVRAIGSVTGGLAWEPRHADEYRLLREHPVHAGYVDDVPEPVLRLGVFHTDAEPEPGVSSPAFGGVGLAVRILVGVDASPSVEVRVSRELALDAQAVADALVAELDASGLLVVAAEPGSHAALRRVDRLPLTAVEAEHVRTRYGADAQLLPLSPLQSGLLYHMVRSRESGDHHAYVSQVTRELSGTVDAARMADAIATVLQRYPNLSAGFVAFSEGEIQVIPAGPSAPLRVVRRERWQAEGATVEGLLAAERAEPFDHEHPPLIRFALLERSEREWTLAMTFEHILMDGWSLHLVLGEILAIYGDPSYAERTPAASFRTYLDWLAGRDADAARSAWRDYLADLPGPSVVWPAGGDLTGTRIDTGELHEDLDVAEAADLYDAARRAQVTVGTLLQVAWGLALSRVTGSGDVVFGNTVSGRPAELADAERIVGLLFNTLPLRVRLDPFETVAALLHRVQVEQLDVIDHFATPLSDIQDDAGVGTLFDTLFVVQNFPYRVDDAADDEARVTGGGLDDATHYPVTFAVNPWIDGDRASVHVRLSFRRDAFAHGAAQRLLARYLHSLRFVIASLDEPVGGFTGVLPGEIVRRGDGGDDRQVEQVTVAQLLERQVACSPERTALVARGRSFTFAQFAAEVHRYARALLDLGVRPEHRVALLLPRDERMVVAMFAVFAVGAAYVPVDAEHPDDRIAHMLSVARPTVTLVTDRDVARLGPDAGEVVNLDDARVLDRIAAASPEPIDVAERGSEVSLDALAYIIFTSGSTGRPKGVAVGYRGLTNMYANHVEAIFDRVVAHQGGRRMRIAHTTSFSFDASWEQLFWMLNGHEVHIIDEALRREPERLLRYYDAESIDGFDVTPSYGQLLVDQGLLERDRPAGRSVAADAEGVVFVSLGGESVPERLWQQLRDAPGVEAYNLYGPTEYTINALGADLADSPTSSVGTPILHTRAYILDGALQPVLDGVVGELYLAGAGIARGYWQQPAATAERFPACPWEPGARMYRTGDLARWTATGDIEYLGRADDQVKIRGYRIEPGEVADVLAGAEGVVRAAVVARKDASGAMQLCGYVVAVSGAPTDFDLEVVRARARAMLPDYMVPAALAAVAEIPLTVNGKVDVRALPEIEAADAEYVEPRTPTERMLATIAAEVLGIERLSTHASFFDSGGNSLLAMRLVARVNAAADLGLLVRDLFAHQSVAAIAEHLDARSPSTEPTVSDAMLLPLRETDGATTLFCFHEYTGVATMYRHLLPLVPAEWSVYGIQDPVHGGVDVEFEDFADACGAYADALVARRPDGPYDLLGWSYGGHLAYGVARELVRRGHTVRAIAIVDAVPIADGPLQEDVDAVGVTMAELRADPALQDRIAAGIEREVGPELGERMFGGLDAAQRRAIAVAATRVDLLLTAPTDGRLDTPTLLVAAAGDAEQPEVYSSQLEAMWSRFLPRLRTVRVDTPHSEVVLGAGQAERWMPAFVGLVTGADDRLAVGEGMEHS